MADTALVTDDKEVLTYGAAVLRKGALEDESQNAIVDEDGNNIYGYGIVATSEE